MKTFELREGEGYGTSAMAVIKAIDSDKAMRIFVNHSCPWVKTEQEILDAMKELHCKEIKNKPGIIFFVFM